MISPRSSLLLSAMTVMTLALAGCGASSPESPHPDTAKTSSLVKPVDDTSPWAVLDHGIAVIESKQADATKDQARRDHWAMAQTLTADIPHDPATMPQITASLEDLDLLALSSRPEIHNDTKSLHDVKTLRETTLNSFPGIRDVLSKDMTQAQWTAFVGHFTDGLVRIHTLPVTMKDEASKTFLQTMQQQAMTAAILTQVHLAYADYQSARTTMTAKPSQETAVQVWNKYAVLMQSLGADALPDDAARLNPAQLAVIITDRLEKTDPAAVNQWVEYAQNQIPMQNNKKTMEPLPGDLTLVSYKPDVTMPIPQKISARTGDSSGQSRLDPSSFLHISHWQVKSLLDAPITEP